jgi:hypothetical protein
MGMKTAVFKIVNGVVTEINGQPANGQESVGKRIEAVRDQFHPEYFTWMDDIRVTVKRIVVFGLVAGKSVSIADSQITIDANGEHIVSKVLPLNDNYELSCYSQTGATCLVVVDYTAERFNY